MTSIIKFTPLSGGASMGENETTVGLAPHCYLLQLDECRILLDCGWDLNFTADFVTNGTLQSALGKIDAVLLSYPDLLHLGALPYAVGKLKLSCPIYCTGPVYKMGQMFMYDAFLSRENVEDFSLFTLDEVDKAFDMMTQLKYNQSVQLKGRGEGIIITPIPAGHMIGGTVWKINKDGEEDFVYAVDFNHKKDQHLNGLTVEQIQRPSLLITDAFNTGYKQIRRRVRDEKFMTLVLQTLRDNGNVLVCVDTAGRVLEISHIIDHLWHIKDSGLLAYSLAMVNNVSYNVVEFAKSQIEWMSEKLIKTFEAKRNNPFQFRDLQLCHSLEEVNRVPDPKVVLASSFDLEHGFARELFQLWCESPKNSVVITSRSPEGTLAYDLINNGSSRNMSLTVKKRVKMTSSEIESLKRQTQAESASAARDSESSDEEDELGGASSGHAKPVKHDLVPHQQERKRTETTFFKSNKAKYLMFPFTDVKIKWDEYGETIRREDWVKDGPEGLNGSLEIVNTKRFQGTETAETKSRNAHTKCVKSIQNFHVKSRIEFIDFEGRSDGDTLFDTIRNIRPRRSIVVRGTKRNANKLADFCRQMSADANAGNTALVPKNGETLDVTTESHIYQVMLPESLVSRISFSAAKDGHIAWIDGVLQVKTDVVSDVDMEVDEAKAEATEAGKQWSLQPVTDPEALDQTNVFVNELKLSDFKLVLLRNDIPSEFIGGVLFCGSNMDIALKRFDSGRVTIEGAMTEDFYKVRELLYNQYAIV